VVNTSQISVGITGAIVSKLIGKTMLLAYSCKSIRGQVDTFSD
jgi:hypothetical protein